MDNRLKIIAGAVLLAGLYWAYQWFGTATIQEDFSVIYILISTKN